MMNPYANLTNNTNTIVTELCIIMQAHWNYADNKSKPNRLIHESSPYPLQHAYNPVEVISLGK